MKRGLQKKIILSFFAIVILSIAVITMVWYSRTSRTMLNIARSYNYKLQQEAEKNFEVALKDIEYLSTIIALNKPNVIDVLKNNGNIKNNYEILVNQRKLDNYLSDIYSYKYYITGIVVSGKDGKTYSQGSGTLVNGENSKYIYDIVEKDPDKVHIWAHSMYDVNDMRPSSSSNVISVGRAIKDKGKVIGFVIIDCRYDIIKSLFNFKLQYGGSDLFIVDYENSFVYNSDEKLLNKSLNDTRYKEIAGFLWGSEGSFMETISGEKIFFIYHKSHHTGWTTISAIPEKAIMKEAVRTFTDTAELSIVILIITLLVAIVISFPITNNIKKLTAKMEEAKNGNLDSIVEISSKDEIGEMGHIYNGMLKTIKALMRDIKEEEKQKRVSEIKALQAQINPHFLSNILNTVKWLADIQNVPNISSLVNSVIELLHVSMGKRKEYITIAEELECIKHYANIQQFKYCDKFKIMIDFEENLMDCRVPRLLLQPIVENAIVHGIGPIDGQGIIYLKGWESDGKIYIKIKDNGVGMDKTQIENIMGKNEDGKELRSSSKNKFSNIGLKNVDERLKLTYGKEYGLTISSIKNAFTEIDIVLPYNK